MDATADLAGVVLGPSTQTVHPPLDALAPLMLWPVGNVPMVRYAIDRLSVWLGAGPDQLALVTDDSHHREQIAACVAALPDHAALTWREVTSPGDHVAKLLAVRDWLAGRDALITTADAMVFGSLQPLLDARHPDRCTALVADVGRASDFDTFRYLDTAIVPFTILNRLAERSGDLRDALFMKEFRDEALELVPYESVAMRCSTPRDYLRANLTVSRGETVYPQGIAADEAMTSSVLWPGAQVEQGERLHHVIRAAAPDGSPITVAVPGS